MLPTLISISQTHAIIPGLPDQPCEQASLSKKAALLQSIMNGGPLDIHANLDGELGKAFIVIIAARAILGGDVESVIREMLDGERQ